MKYTHFKNKIKLLPVFSSSQLTAWGEDLQTFRNQLTYWKKRGLIHSLKKGFYLLNENDRDKTPSRFYVANILFSPSYVSLETALFFYGIIPEEVHDIVSVTLKKTSHFQNILGTFHYHHVKSSSFIGWQKLEDESGNWFLMAEPEKALVDFLYFHFLDIKKRGDVFEDSYRLQREFPFNKKKLLGFASVFGNPFLNEAIQAFVKWQKGKGRD